jgi:hypothetical protein
MIYRGRGDADASLARDPRRRIPCGGHHDDHHRNGDQHTTLRHPPHRRSLRLFYLRHDAHAQSLGNALDRKIVRTENDEESGSGWTSKFGTKGRVIIRRCHS